MAESPVSPLHVFVSVLRKLLTEEFASVKLEQHSTVRKQIESLLQAEEVLASLSLSLYEEISALLKRLPPPADRPRTFQVALWPQFHTFRVKSVPRIWKKVEGVIPEIHAVFVQKATLDYLMAILHNSHTAKDVSVVTDKRSRRENMSMEEHNAIRYAAGYVIRKLKKKYFSKNSLQICQCLISMEEGSTVEDHDDYDDNEPESFRSYTSAWLDKIDRGGLFRVSDEVHQLFIEIELSMYPLLCRNFTNRVDKVTAKDQLLHHVQVDEDVLFAFSLISVDLPPDDCNLLLKDILQLWMTIRGFSIASKIMEDYKEATKKTTKAKKSLRQELMEHNIKDKN